MARFALIAGTGNFTANETTVAFARAAFANGHDGVLIGGTGQDGILPSGAPDLAFDYSDYDSVFAVVNMTARDYRARAQHAADLPSAGALNGIVICGNADEALVDAALASGTPVISLHRSLPANLAVRADLTAVAVDNTGTRSDKAIAHHVQKFMAAHA